MAPAWYKSRSYRARAIREPRKVMAEFGLIIPEEVRAMFLTDHFLLNQGELDIWKNWL